MRGRPKGIKKDEEIKEIDVERLPKAVTDPKALEKITSTNSSRRSGSLYLDRVREEIVKNYAPDFIQKRIGELCSAEDVRIGKEGKEHRTPNWKAREGGLKMIMQIQGIEDIGSAEDQLRERKAPTNITINIVNPPSMEPQTVKEAHEVQELKND